MKPGISLFRTTGVLPMAFANSAARSTVAAEVERPLPLAPRSKTRGTGVVKPGLPAVQRGLLRDLGPHGARAHHRQDPRALVVSVQGLLRSVAGSWSALPCTEKRRVTWLRVVKLPSRPSILSLP